MSRKCIVFCSVKHKLLDELSTRLIKNGLSYQMIDCTYTSYGNFDKAIKIFWNTLRILKGGVFGRKDELLVFHYVSIQALVAIPFLLLLNKKIVIHFWGTDYANFSTIVPGFLLRFFLTKTVAITFANRKALLEFKKNYPLCNAVELAFGLEAIDYIDLEIERGYLKKTNKLPVIVCGTNSSPNQQLLEVIDILDKWPDCKSYKFIFPLAYGDLDYKAAVKSRLSLSKLNYQVNDKFMVGEELALFRLDADLLIQVQKKDFLSGAMVEHVYAGSKIITGQWLPYAQIRELGVSWFEVKALSELPLAIATIANTDIDVVANKDIISRLARWNDVILKWERIYSYEA